MVTKTEEAEGREAAKETLERPTDRPMGGPLARDDGKRTEHGLHPLDPAYNGTAVTSNQGIEDAAAARDEAGLTNAASVPAGDVTVGKDPAEG